MEKKISDDRYKLLEGYKHMQMILSEKTHLYDYLADFYNVNKSELYKLDINSENQFI